MKKDKKLKVVELFAGVDGFRLVLKVGKVSHPRVITPRL